MVKSQKRKGAKRAMVSKGRRMRKTLNVNKSLTPFSQRYITKMKYSENVITGATGVYRFALNNLFDPNLTGVGHQPHGYDQLSTIYNRYRVIGATYSINAYLASPSTTALPVRVACLPANGAITPSGVADVVENPRCRWGLFTVGGPNKPITGKCYLPSICGRSKAEYMADDRYQSANTTGPAEVVLLNLFAETLDGLGANVYFTVTINYHVEWFDVNNLAQS